MLQISSDNPIWKQFLDAVQTAWSPDRWQNVGVVIACSGGADSVALLRSIVDLRCHADNPTGFVVAAHYNHGLRGHESDADEQSVKELAERLAVKFISERAPDASPRDEASMRSQRRDFLVRVAAETGCRYIATGHSADDNVETVLHHLMRGTGPSGMAGISRHSPIGKEPGCDDFVLVRPMLSVRRAQIRDALQSIDQSWREDASNSNTDYRRNWIRHELIPLMESQYPECVGAMGRTIELQHELRSSLWRLSSQWLAEHRIGETRASEQPASEQWASETRASEQRVDADVVKLSRDASAETSIVVAALQQLWDQQTWPRREMTMTHWQRVARTIRSSREERYTAPGGIDVVANSRIVSLIRR
tara:strand:- start:192412 stop:193503 length:1092 start_codon:yes stop_codon:yes gene_type:complete